MPTDGAKDLVIELSIAPDDFDDMAKSKKYVPIVLRDLMTLCSSSFSRPA